MLGFIALEELDEIEPSTLPDITATSNDADDKTQDTEAKPRTQTHERSQVRSKKQRKPLQKPVSHSNQTGQKDQRTLSQPPIVPVEASKPVKAVISDVSRWDPCKLSKQMLNALATAGFSGPTPIQSLTIPCIIAGDDVVGKASTGSGKTLAFGIPILEHVLSDTSENRTISALIVVPTRELAQQVFQHLKAVTSEAQVRVMTLTGGLASEKQDRLMAKIPDIVVATPGRLWEFMSSKPDIFDALRFLVLDEADRLLQNGHFEDLAKVLDKLGASREHQTLVFSATFDQYLQKKLDKKGPGLISASEGQQSALENLLRKVRFRSAPRFLDADPGLRVSRGIKQSVIQVTPMEKDFILSYLILRYPARVLIFSNSISDVSRLVKLLCCLGIAARGLHSNKQQSSRLKTLDHFKNSQNSVLVATDVAARGLDIPLVDIVVHYHLPRTTDMYIHRSGRTARGTTAGSSIVICSSSEVEALKRMTKALEATPLKDFPVEASHLNAIRPRVLTARKVIALETKISQLKTPAGKTWLGEALEDLGIDQSMTEEETDQIRKMNKELTGLKALLKQQCKNVKTKQGQYLTKQGSSLATRLLAGTGHSTFIGDVLESALDVV